MKTAPKLGLDCSYLRVSSRVACPLGPGAVPAVNVGVLSHSHSFVTAAAAHDFPFSCHVKTFPSTPPDPLNVGAARLHWRLPCARNWRRQLKLTPKKIEIYGVIEHCRNNIAINFNIFLYFCDCNLKEEFYHTSCIVF